MKVKKQMSLVFALALALSVVPTVQAQTSYQPYEIGKLSGASQSIPNAVNSKGQVVGYGWPIYNKATRTNYKVAFLYSGGGIKSLSTLDGNGGSEANDINNQGQAVGWAHGPDGSNRAFIYDSANGMRDLNGLIGNFRNEYFLRTASRIDDNGTIKVQGSKSTGEGFDGLLHPLEDGTFTVTEILPWIVQQNAAGERAGMISGRIAYQGPNDVEPTLLPYVAPTGITPSGSGFFYDLNDNGVITGNTKYSGYTHAAVWFGGSGASTVLPELTGTTSQSPWAINNANTVVGYARYDGSKAISYAVRWWQNGAVWQVNDLNKLTNIGTSRLTEARAIASNTSISTNGPSNIVAVGGTKSGANCTYLLVPKS